MAKRSDRSDPDPARQAAARGDWQVSFELFMELDADGSLDVADVAMLAEVAYAAGHLDVTIAAWEQVYRACVASGDHLGAAGAAARVATHLILDTALMAPVRGWLRRSGQHLDGQPDSPAHAEYSAVRAYERLLSGDLAEAGESARRAIEVGSACDPASAAIGQVVVARLLLIDGDVDSGLALLEDVGVTATGGGLDPLSTGIVYCELVCALQGAAQYDLAEEWTEAMERWCAKSAVGTLHGRCRVHRAEILRLRGRCHEAEVEASAACDELRQYLGRELGWPLAELGQIRLRRGNHSGAHDALLAAHRVGWDPQPGLARLHLARGDVALAANAIREALEQPMLVPSKERPPNNDLCRAPLLAAQVEIEIANDEIDRARAAADELDQIAARFQATAFAAEAHLARGRLELADGNLAAAERHLTTAAHAWRDMRAPYELAITRGELAAVYRALGRHQQADLEDEARRALLDGIRDGGPGREQHPDRADGVVDDETGSASRLVREGDYWTVAYHGHTVRVQDLKGIHYLARMLGDPTRELHVLDLVVAENPRPAAARPARRGREPATFDDAGEVLDDQARTAYRRRLAEIDDDIEEARSAGDLARAAQAEAEREFLVRELSNAFGIGGRSRKARATSERARVAVTRALRTAINRISEHHPALGQHLGHAIRTGTYCSYQPDPASPVRWQL
jgi:tetratricopeptide (TPR) repeat protein